MSEAWWNICVWVVGWLGYFCAFEGVAVFLDPPWTTFSRFIWDAQAKWEFLTVPIVAILGILASHLIRFASIQEGERKLTMKQEVHAARVRRAQLVIAKHAPTVA